MKLDLSKRIILYYDVLGYKQKFLDNGFDALEYLKTIKGVVSKTQEYAKAFGPRVSGTIELRIFSDNACLVFNIDDKSIGLTLAKILAYDLQQILLEEYEVLIRGCISYGDIYMDDDLIYGSGLIKSVELEGKAEFPRIIIDPSLNDLIFDDAFGMLENITDDYYEVTYLNPHIIGDFEERDMTVVRERIVKMTNMYCKSGAKEAVIKKYRWLVEKFNSFLPESPIRTEECSDQCMEVS